MQQQMSAMRGDYKIRYSHFFALEHMHCCGRGPWVSGMWAVFVAELIFVFVRRVTDETPRKKCPEPNRSDDIPVRTLFGLYAVAVLRLVTWPLSPTTHIHHDYGLPFRA